jgi:hypothetical protein
MEKPIYPVIQLSSQTLMRAFNDYQEAMDYCKALVAGANNKRDFFIATYNTEGLLSGFKIKNLRILYNDLNLEPKLRVNTCKSIAAAILRCCDQPPHLPRKKLTLKPRTKRIKEDFKTGDELEKIVASYAVPPEKEVFTRIDFPSDRPYYNIVNLSQETIQDAMEKAKARVARRLSKATYTPKKPLTPQEKIESPYLKETKQRYKFVDGKPSERFLYHKYILAGVDPEVILQRISNQLGVKQTGLERYFKYCDELFRLGVIEKVYDFRKEEYLFEQQQNTN